MCCGPRCVYSTCLLFFCILLDLTVKHMDNGAITKGKLLPSVTVKAKTHFRTHLRTRPEEKESVTHVTCVVFEEEQTNETLFFFFP